MKASVSKKTLFMAHFALLLAIEAIVCFTPLGSLPAIGPIVATLGMVPVSYTHLDVYKRQLLSRAGSSGNLPCFSSFPPVSAC